MRITLNKKAVTPVIAIVLLLMMTVAAAAGAYFWIGSLSTQIESAATSQVSQTLGSAGASLSVVSLICKNETMDSTSQGNITAIVQNTGTESIDSGDWYVILRDSEGNDLETTTYNPESSVSSNGFVTLYANLTELTSGTVDSTDYSVRLTSPVGSSGTATCTLKEGQGS